MDNLWIIIDNCRIFHFGAVSINALSKKAGILLHQKIWPNCRQNTKTRL